MKVDYLRGGIFLKKFFCTVTVCFCFFWLGIGNVQASDNLKGISYDLIQGGTQEYYEIDEDGIPILISVEEAPGISLFSVGNGNYKISGSKFGMWEASYYVTVSKNKFTRVYSPSVSAITGSFTSTNLSLVSSKKASYTLVWKAGIISTTSYLNATLTDSSIDITY